MRIYTYKKRRDGELKAKKCPQRCCGPKNRQSIHACIGKHSPYLSGLPIQPLGRSDSASAETAEALYAQMNARNCRIRLTSPLYLPPYGEGH